jgi:small subunit ribosomal protein S20
MANHASARKRIRQNTKQAKINSSRKSRIRTFVKKVESALKDGDVAAAQTALKAVQPELMRGVSKGVLHKKTASRKMSRLSSKVKAASKGDKPVAAKTTKTKAASKK